ncbi:PucR family transcriptional regulator [Rhodococcus sp. D2-41]|uniref:Helix-turn-helix domain-containing protein n=2 Tax=Speluncibacter jeojiensis TaxID=2710754 RepID=A0A9X4RD93_9ACTN|nr:PucR family transcriptional regulator [Rhodococcus sp. D2-41]MDG3010937.1 PucR family transcriptional regulator [Rhodococcus sp. D2-41]MDG3013912.1 helix-turn-helix domain-containing protein [Corynebacteriales bacterium D3-21]
MVEACLRLSVSTLELGHLPDDGDFTPVRVLASRGARSGERIDHVLSQCHRAMAGAREIVLEQTIDVTVDSLRTRARLLLSLAERVSEVASASYVATATTVESTAPAVVHVVDALLAGRDATTLAARCGLVLADQHTVVAFTAARRPADLSAARGTVPGLERALVAELGAPLLARLSPRQCTLLLPGSPHIDEVRSHLDRVSGIADVDITATAVPAQTGDVAHAADQAHELLVLARHLGHAPDLYRLADLALEYQLTRPGPARDRLLELLGPLEAAPELLETLEVHIDNDLNRQRTARKLHLHPNTVDYRMKRVAQLTGCDPVRASGRWQLRSALVVREFVRGTGQAAGGPDRDA